MAEFVQSVPGLSGVGAPAFEEAREPENWRTKEGAHLFGIRHLSAAGAWHLRRFLDRIKPDAVLIESPADTEPLIQDLTRSSVKPPVAVLCYTVNVPVHSLVYPLARYSPEYQALLWAKKHRKISRFIDLPSYHKAPLYQIEDRIQAGVMRKKQEAEAKQPQGETGAPPELPDSVRNRLDFYQFNQSLYEQAALLGGEEDYESYWERNFEHNLETDAYLRAVSLHSAEMRRLAEGWEKDADPLASSINALRESYMKRRIAEAVAEGVAPEKIVAVLGAYHISGVMGNEAMTDKELAALPRSETRMTLMPYTYYRLSTFSGYGAGNYAPFYFEMMYDAMEKGELSSLPSRYITELSRLYRSRQGYSSTASAIEAARLARSLQYLHNGTLPTLKDLRDSAVSAMAGGEFASIAESLAALNVGTRVGALPEGVSQTPIQDDMNRLLKELRLEAYKEPVAKNLELDLRENRKVQSEKAAFRDLERSVFLHRLAFLGIEFGTLESRRQDGATWKENWTLCWTPEVEIRLVESVLFGDTVEAAAAYTLRDRLEKTQDVLEVAALVKTTCECRLSASILDALKKLQALSSMTENFSAAAKAAREMSFLTQYGSIRKFDTREVIPILEQLFLKAALLLYGAASCDDDTARAVADDMNLLHYVSQEQDGVVNDEAWLARLNALAKADDRNPLLSGFAFSILMERGRVTEEDLASGLSRHLSAGNAPEAGAAWFEGLSRRNRQALLSRAALWKHLDLYIQGLDGGRFKRTLVCLRRAFSSFDPHEKSGICTVLADLWGVDPQGAAETLQDIFSESEEAALNDLKDFDMDL
ncbi:MAG: DUF5682 family protein [Spirochaetaceae bacterium]|jgi:hypothetical protein|nr:DUF5682 family protein [Spirochaetaceae bacterium]